MLSCFFIFAQQPRKMSRVEENRWKKESLKQAKITMLKTAGKCFKNTYENPKNKSVRMQKQ